MQKEMNKKAQDLSIGTLILIVLGIVVLVILVLGFSMGWDNLWNKINIFGGTSSIGDVVTACRLAATSQDTFMLCERSWDVKLPDGKEEKGITCQKLKDTGRLDVEFQCTPKNFDQLCAIAGGEVQSTKSCEAHDGKKDEVVPITNAQPPVTDKICCKYT